jgi:hypothetical protein
MVFFCQGDLSDPLYFDFISFAQFATLSEEMLRGRQVFEVMAHVMVDTALFLHIFRSYSMYCK